VVEETLRTQMTQVVLPALESVAKEMLSQVERSLTMSLADVASSLTAAAKGIQASTQALQTAKHDLVGTMETVKMAGKDLKAKAVRMEEAATKVTAAAAALVAAAGPATKDGGQTTVGKAGGGKTEAPVDYRAQVGTLLQGGKLREALVITARAEGISMDVRRMLVDQICLKARRPESLLPTNGGVDDGNGSGSGSVEAIPQSVLLDITGALGSGLASSVGVCPVSLRVEWLKAALMAIEVDQVDRMALVRTLEPVGSELKEATAALGGSEAYEAKMTQMILKSMLADD